MTSNIYFGAKSLRIEGIYITFPAKKKVMDLLMEKKPMRLVLVKSYECRVTSRLKSLEIT